MTWCIAIPSEKGLERSSSPSGRSKKRALERNTYKEVKREREPERRSKRRERMRESIEQVPATSAPVGTTIKLPLDQPHTNICSHNATVSKAQINMCVWMKNALMLMKSAH